MRALKVLGRVRAKGNARIMACNALIDLPDSLLELCAGEKELCSITSLLCTAKAWCRLDHLWLRAFALRFFDGDMSQAEAVRCDQISWRMQYAAFVGLNIDVATNKWDNSEVTLSLCGLPIRASKAPVNQHGTLFVSLEQALLDLLPLMDALRSAATASTDRSEHFLVGHYTAQTKLTGPLPYHVVKGIEEPAAEFDTLRLACRRRKRDGMVTCMLSVRQSRKALEQRRCVEEVRTRAAKPVFVAECAPSLLGSLVFNTKGPRVMPKPPACFPLPPRAVAAGVVFRSRAVMVRRTDRKREEQQILVRTRDVQPTARTLRRAPLHSLTVGVLLGIDRALRSAMPEAGAETAAGAAADQARETALREMGFGAEPVRRALAANPPPAGVAACALWLLDHPELASLDVPTGKYAAMRRLAEATMPLCAATGYRPVHPAWATWLQAGYAGTFLEEDSEEDSDEDPGMPAEPDAEQPSHTRAKRQRRGERRQRQSERASDVEEPDGHRLPAFAEPEALAVTRDEEVEDEHAQWQTHLHPFALLARQVSSEL